MKLAVIFPALNQQDLTNAAIDFADVYSGLDVEIVALDNGSQPKFERPAFPQGRQVKIVRLEKNIGVYPTFWEGLKHTDADIIAYLHSDLILAEKGWDIRVLSAFQNKPNLGLLGFIGSNEIDFAGGRGLGTTSNFQGLTTERNDGKGNKKIWTGSKASVHGRVFHGLSDAAVVDGCAMVFRREVLEQIKQRENFPLHHFYDRLLSCEVRELGRDVAVLGIACDHISGQSVNGSEAYEKMAQEWCEAHGIPKEHNWDSAVYHEAERLFLKEYRDLKRLIPCKV